MDYLVAQRGWHCESSAVYYGPRSRGRNAGDVADCAADRVEYVLARLRISGRGKGLVPRGRLGRTHKPGECIYVVRRVLWVSGHLADGGEVRRIEAIRDPLFIEVSITGERQQARHLILPPKAADTVVSERLKNRHLDNQWVDAAAALVDFVVGDRNQGIAVDRLDEPVAERVQAGAERPDIFGPGNPFLNVSLQEIMLHSICVYYDTWTNSAVINQRTIWDRGVAVIDEYGRIDKVAGRVLVPAPQLGYLANAAADWVLMALATRLGIVSGSEPGSRVVHFVERIPIRSKRCRISKSITDKGVVVCESLGCGLALGRSGPGKGRDERNGENDEHRYLD